MGDRYFLEETCQVCGEHQTVMYAESCNMTEWKCPKCGQEYEMNLVIKSQMKLPKKGRT